MKSRGFTLIEILVVLAIIGIAAAVIALNVGAARERARDAKRVENVNQIDTAIALYLTENGTPPGDDGVEYINGNPAWIPGLAPRYIREVPSDPVDTGDYKFHYARQGINYEVAAFMEQNGSDASCGDGGNSCQYYEKASGAFLAFVNPGASGWSFGSTTTSTSTPPGPPPDPPPATTSCTLSASPTSIQSGSSATLSWTTANTTSFSISNGIGSVSPVAGGSTTVSPTATTTYTGTATGTSGSVTCTALVAVSAVPPPPPPPSNCSDSVGTTTAAGGAPSLPVVTTASATCIDADSATFQGTGAPKKAVTTGFFRYSQVSAACSNSFGVRVPTSGGTNLGSGNSAVTYAITYNSLSPRTTYYYCASATNSVGTGFGTVLSFLTTASTTAAAGSYLRVFPDVQPTGGNAVQGTLEVPFTTFVLTNNSDAATFTYDFYIRKTGTASDAAITRVLIRHLLPTQGTVSTNGIYSPTVWRVGQNPSYVYTFSLAAGESRSFTIIGQMSTNYGTDVGKTVGLELTAVNASLPVSTTLPVTGTTYTLTLQ